MREDMDERLLLPIRVLLVASCGIVLFGLKKLIEHKNSGMKVIGEFELCSLIFSEAVKLCPDVIVIDADEQPKNIAEVISELVRLFDLKIIVLGGSDEGAVGTRAMMAGARGIIDKKDAVETITKAIEKVHEGQLWLNRTRMSKLLDKLANKSAEENNDPNRIKIKMLTARERAVVAAVTSHAHAPYKLVADKLHISERTLRNHLASIYQKLGVCNRLALWDYAHTHGLNGIAAGRIAT